MNRIISLIIALLALLPLMAQEPADTVAAAADNGPHKWLGYVKDYKYQMLEREAQMTREQAEQFFPLYQEMERKVLNANLEARRLELQVSDDIDQATDDDFARAARALSDVKRLEAEIEQEYYPQFEQILSSKQMFLLKRAETHFATDMLRHYNRSRERNQ